MKLKSAPSFIGIFNFSFFLDATVKCWDMKSKSQEPIQTLQEMRDGVTSILVTDHEILIGSADGKVRTYDLRNGKLVTDMITFDGSAISSISLTSDGQCYLVNTTKSDDSLKLMDKNNGALLQEYFGVTNKKGYRLEATIGFESKQILAGSDDGKINMFDLVRGTKVNTLSVSEDVVHSLSYHPTKEEFACGSKHKMFIYQSDV